MRGYLTYNVKSLVPGAYLHAQCDEGGESSPERQLLLFLRSWCLAVQSGDIAPARKLLKARLLLYQNKETSSDELPLGLDGGVMMEARCRLSGRGAL